MPSRSESPKRSPKERAAAFLPAGIVATLDRLVFMVRRMRVRAVQGLFGALGYNVVKKADYYSTLPVLGEIEKTRHDGTGPAPSPGSRSTCPR